MDDVDDQQEPHGAASLEAGPEGEGIEGPLAQAEAAAAPQQALEANMMDQEEVSFWCCVCAVCCLL